MLLQIIKHLFPLRSSIETNIKNLQILSVKMVSFRYSIIVKNAFIFLNANKSKTQTEISHQKH